MTFTHQDIQTHLIDFLYGDLDADARAAFQSHVDGCASCREQLVEFQQTQRVTRAHLSESMNEALPEGLHARLLALAGPATTATATTATATTAAGPEGVAANRAPQQESLWNRLLSLWSRPWALPTLGTLAAAAVFLLVRETIFREARHPLSDQTSVTAPQEATAPTSVPPGAASAPAAQAVQVHNAVAPASGEVGVGDLHEMKAASPSSERRPAASRGGQPSGAAVAAKASSSHRRNKSASARGAASKPSAVIGDRSDDGASLADRFADKALAADDDSVLGGLGASGASRGGGAPSKGASSNVASPNVASPNVALPKLDVSKDDSLSSLSSSSSSAKRAPVAKVAAAPENKVKVIRAEAEAFEEESAPRKKESASARIAPAPPPSAPRARPIAASAEPSAQPSAPTPSSPSEGSAPPAADSVDTSMVRAPAVRAARAEKLMATGAWNQAIAIYKALLKEFPHDAAASTWRRRMAEAEAAAKRSGSSFAQPPSPSAK